MERRERNRWIASLWADIVDIIGPANLWPHRIRCLFWTRNIHHFDRLFVAAFLFVNGLNPEIFLDWVNLLHLCRDRAAFIHFENLFHYFEVGRYYNLYAYNVTHNVYEYLDEE